MAKIFNNLTELIGRTPLLRLNRVAQPGAATVVAKVEGFNPGGSGKDRIGFAMIEDAEAKIARELYPCSAAVMARARAVRASLNWPS